MFAQIYMRVDFLTLNKNMFIDQGDEVIYHSFDSVIFKEEFPQKNLRNYLVIPHHFHFRKRRPYHQFIFNQ